MDQRSLEFIQRFSIVFEQIGGARSAGLIWGWLLMASEPQSLDDLASGLSLSKASVSLYTRLLEQMGIIERVAIHGDRKTYYQVSDRAWELVFEFGIRKLEALIDLAAQGASVAADPKVKDRLIDMQDSLTFVLGEYKLLAKKLQHRNKESDSKPQSEGE